MLSPQQKRKDRIYREYMEFFDRSERTRRWHLNDDICWDWLEKPEISEQIKNKEGVADDAATATRLESYCAVEMYVPDAVESGLNLTRDFFGQSWFYLQWGYEESKHSLACRTYLERSGLRTVKQYMEFEQEILKKKWVNPFHNYRQVACYGALQEIVTFQIYKERERFYQSEGNILLQRIFFLLARDEAAHAAFYRNYMKYEFEEDTEGAEEDLAFVISKFEMPGANLIPNYQEKLKVTGVGISTQSFLENALMPTLKYFNMTRSNMAKALTRYKTKYGYTEHSHTEHSHTEHSPADLLKKT